MKLKRSEAIAAYTGLTMLEKGNGENKPFSLSWDMWDKVFRMMAQLQPVADRWNKSRQQRFANLANGDAVINDPKIAMLFQREEDAALEEIISVKMPKELPSETQLALRENRIPPSVLIMLRPLIRWNEDGGAFDDDQDNY